MSRTGNSLNSFTGRWDPTTALEILEFMRGRRGSHALTIKDPNGVEAYLAFADGDLLVALTDRSAGINALADVLAWDDSEFVGAAVRSLERNIDKPGPEAIFEAISIHDARRELPIEIEWEGEEEDEELSFDGLFDAATGGTTPQKQGQVSPTEASAGSGTAENMRREVSINQVDPRPELHSRPTVAAMERIDPEMIKRELAKKAGAKEAGKASSPQAPKSDGKLTSSAPSSGFPGISMPKSDIVHDRTTPVTPLRRISDPVLASDTAVVAALRDIPVPPASGSAPGGLTPSPGAGTTAENGQSAQTITAPPVGRASSPSLAPMRPSSVPPRPRSPLASTAVGVANRPEVISEKLLRASSSMQTVPGVRSISIFDLRTGQLLGFRPSSAEPKELAEWCKAENMFVRDLIPIGGADEVISFTADAAHIMRPWQMLGVYVRCDRDINLGIARIRLQNILKGLA
jgi:hypothetical protein